MKKTLMKFKVNEEGINRYGDNRFVRYTHMEFNKWTMMGEVSCGIPFINHKNIHFIYIIKRSILHFYYSSLKLLQIIFQIIKIQNTLIH